MGLDWVVKSKVKPGFEFEYNKLKKQIKAAEKKLENTHDTINKEKISKILEELEKRYLEVSIAPYETANSYKIGSNPEKDLQVYQAESNKGLTLEEFVEKNKGLYYTNFSDKEAIAGNGSFAVGIFDFRGKIISTCEYLSDELRDKCYNDMEPSQMFELAEMIENELPNIVEENEDYINSCTHAITWLKFWAKNGHGIHAWW